MSKQWQNIPILLISNLAIRFWLQYFGVWYESEKYPNYGTTFGRCTTANYFEDNLGVTRVYNQQITSITNQEDSIAGVMWSEGGARLRVELPTSPWYVQSNYWVLATDYCDYAVVFSCTNVWGLYHNRYVWIYTRARHPKPYVLIKAYQAMDDNGLERKHLRRTQQNNCEDFTNGVTYAPVPYVCL